MAKTETDGLEQVSKNDACINNLERECKNYANERGLYLVIQYPPKIDMETGISFSFYNTPVIKDYACIGEIFLDHHHLKTFGIKGTPDFEHYFSNRLTK